MKEDFLLGLNPKGFHKIVFTQWGGEHKDSVPVICAHGLARNGRDFDQLAAELARTRTVYCPDFAGRGRSQDLPDAALYDQKQYMADMTALIARTGAKQVDWVGTSMGGITGMLLAALPGAPIRRLVLNDVGPVVTASSIEKIRGYLSATPVVASVGDIEAVLRRNYSGFGALPDEAWRHMAKHSVRVAPDGKIGLAYDPRLVVPLLSVDRDIEFWGVYDAISATTLLLRGADSGVLAADVAAEMTKRGPRAELRTFPNIGHAPSLMVREQIEVISEFLNRSCDMRPVGPA